VSLNAATIEILIAKGLSAADLLEVARATEVKADPTNAARQARHRAKRRSNAVTVTEAPLNEDTSKPRNPNGTEVPSSPLADRVVEAWNEGPGKRGARAARALDASRRKLLSLREREHGEEAVFEAIRNLAASQFHCGENERGWRANIGWLLKAENFLKMLEMSPVQANGCRTLTIAEQIEAAEKNAAFFDRIHRPDDAAEYRAKAARLRSTGPPMPIGSIPAIRHLSSTGA
jgi:hypothetical protein